MFITKWLSLFVKKKPHIQSQNFISYDFHSALVPTFLDAMDTHGSNLLTIRCLFLLSVLLQSLEEDTDDFGDRCHPEDPSVWSMMVA